MHRFPCHLIHGQTPKSFSIYILESIYSSELSSLQSYSWDYLFIDFSDFVIHKYFSLPNICTLSLEFMTCKTFPQYHYFPCSSLEGILFKFHVPQGLDKNLCSLPFPILLQNCLQSLFSSASLKQMQSDFSCCSPGSLSPFILRLLLFIH